MCPIKLNGQNNWIENSQWITVLCIYNIYVIIANVYLKVLFGEKLPMHTAGGEMVDFATYCVKKLCENDNISRAYMCKIGTHGAGTSAQLDFNVSSLQNFCCCMHIYSLLRCPYIASVYVLRVCVSVSVCLSVSVSVCVRVCTYFTHGTVYVLQAMRRRCFSLPTASYS